MTQKNQYNSCLVWMSKIIKKQVSYFDTDQIFSQNVVKLLKEIKYIDLENREYSDPIKNYTYLTRYFRTKNRKIEAKKLIGKENRDLLINLIFQLRNEYENSLIINNSNQVERNESKFELKSEESLMNEKIHEQTQKNFLSESASFTIVAINQNDTQTKGTLRLTSSNFQISLINNFNYTKKYQKTNKLKILLSSIDLTLFKINCVKFSFNLKASSEMERMVICKTFQMFQTYRDDISGNCNIDGNILGKKKEITLISKKILQKQETTFIGDLIAKKTEAVMIRLGNKDFVLERENGDLQQFSWENRSFKTRINSKNQVEILISREKEEKQESAIVLQMLSQENALLLARCVVIFAENFSESFAKSEKQMKQKITEYGLEFQNDAEIIQAEIKMMQTREEETRAFVESIVSQLKVPFVTYFNEQDGRPTSIQRRQLYPQIFTSIAVKYENEYDWEMKKEISKWMRTGEAIFYVKTPMFPDSHMKITANGVQLIDSQKRVFLELLFQSGLQMFLHSENSCLFSLISASFRTFVFISEDVQSRDEIFNIFTVFSSLSDLSGEKKFSIQNRGLPIISEVSQYSRWADPDKLEVLSKEFSNKNEIYISRFFVESNENTSIYQEITGGSKNATQSRYHANLIDSFYSFAGKISVLLAKDFFTVEIDLPVSFSYNPYCRAYLNHCEPRFCTLYLDEVLLVNIVFLKRREAEMFATDFAQKSANAIASNPGLSPYQTKLFDCTILSPTGKVNSRIYLDHTYFVIYSQMGRFSSDYLIFNRVKSKNGTTVILDLDSVRYLILLFPNKTLSKQFISHFRMRRMRFLGRGVFEPLFTRFKVVIQKTKVGKLNANLILTSRYFVILTKRLLVCYSMETLSSQKAILEKSKSKLIFQKKDKKKYAIRFRSASERDLAFSILRDQKEYLEKIEDKEKLESGYYPVSFYSHSGAQILFGKLKIKNFQLFIVQSETISFAEVDKVTTTIVEFCPNGLLIRIDKDNLEFIVSFRESKMRAEFLEELEMNLNLFHEEKRRLLTPYKTEKEEEDLRPPLDPFLRLRFDATVSQLGSHFEKYFDLSPTHIIFHKKDGSESSYKWSEIKLSYETDTSKYKIEFIGEKHHLEPTVHINIEEKKEADIFKSLCDYLELFCNEKEHFLALFRLRAIRNNQSLVAFLVVTESKLFFRINVVQNVYKFLLSSPTKIVHLAQQDQRMFYAENSEYFLDFKFLNTKDSEHFLQILEPIYYVFPSLSEKRSDSFQQVIGPKKSLNIPIDFSFSVEHYSENPFQKIDDGTITLTSTQFSLSFALKKKTYTVSLPDNVQVIRHKTLDLFAYIYFSEHNFLVKFQDKSRSWTFFENFQRLTQSKNIFSDQSSFRTPPQLILKNDSDSQIEFDSNSFANSQTRSGSPPFFLDSLSESPSQSTNKMLFQDDTYKFILDEQPQEQLSPQYGVTEIHNKFDVEIFRHEKESPKKAVMIIRKSTLFIGIEKDIEIEVLFGQETHYKQTKIQPISEMIISGIQMNIVFHSQSEQEQFSYQFESKKSEYQEDDQRSNVDNKPVMKSYTIKLYRGTSRVLTSELTINEGKLELNLGKQKQTFHSGFTSLTQSKKDDLYLLRIKQNQSSVQIQFKSLREIKQFLDYYKLITEKNSDQSAPKSNYNTIADVVDDTYKRTYPANLEITQSGKIKLVWNASVEKEIKDLGYTHDTSSNTTLRIEISNKLYICTFLSAEDCNDFVLNLSRSGCPIDRQKFYFQITMLDHNSFPVGSAFLSLSPNIVIFQSIDSFLTFQKKKVSFTMIRHSSQLAINFESNPPLKYQGQFNSSFSFDIFLDLLKNFEISFSSEKEK